ncbi:hypothetical protein M0C40_01095 [Spiroplasma citri]|uniref:Plectrovirus-related protein n=2 Tax=Spiroplasma citri TaxID=2133 RepID=A0AAX3SZE2_SPICI|nr:hypothetical protein [Spiroplasma citri]WFG96644.1 hypothetical protein M0C40_01095 [Spiroplasma citri]
MLKNVEDSVATILLGSGLVFKTYKQFRKNKNLSKTIKSKTLLNSRKFISKKIYSKKRKW